MILPLAFAVFALTRPLLFKRAVKAAYRKTRSLHGPLSMAVGEQGMSFEGPDFSSQLKWPFFLKFAEDDKNFVIYQTNQLFFCIPKRQLSQQEISNIREALTQHIPKIK
ncbi:MAG TPA: YcxB family protein [Candidatus Angelobacter sp.]